MLTAHALEHNALLETAIGRANRKLFLQLLGKIVAATQSYVADIDDTGRT